MPCHIWFGWGIETLFTGWPLGMSSLTDGLKWSYFGIYHRVEPSVVFCPPNEAIGVGEELLSEAKRH
jgi:hypothetical protein